MEEIGADVMKLNIHSYVPVICLMMDHQALWAPKGWNV